MTQTNNRLTDSRAKTRCDRHDCASSDIELLAVGYIVPSRASPADNH